MAYFEANDVVYFEANDVAYDGRMTEMRELQLMEPVPPPPTKKWFADQGRNTRRRGGRSAAEAKQAVKVNMGRWIANHAVRLVSLEKNQSRMGHEIRSQEVLQRVP